MEGRLEVWRRARVDEGYRRECLRRSAEDFEWWCDTFGMTYNPKDHPERPHRPFVLHGLQRDAARRVIEATGKHNLVGFKGRQLGFTWMMVAVRLWMWLFKPGLSFLFGSRKEELVDSPGNPASIFWKLDYMLKHLPKWMIPEYDPRRDRKRMHLWNVVNGSTIDGESTNSNLARGGTRTAIDLDEFSAVENGYEILKSVSDATNSCVFFGTPMDISSAFYELLTRYQEEHPEWVIRWHWSEHPEKRQGLYTSENGVLKLLDEEYWKEHGTEGYPFVLDGRLRSVPYDQQAARVVNQQSMDQEWDLQFGSTSVHWFDVGVLNRLRQEARPPLRRGELILPDGEYESYRWFEKPDGAIRLWVDWEGGVPGKIPSWDDVVIGCDVAMGRGGEYSSNSVASVVRASTGEKIGEYVVRHLDVTDFCRNVLALCVMFHRAYLIWEGNGAGGMFTKAVKDFGYRNVYMRDASISSFVTRKSWTPGWWSNRESKRVLLMDYAHALITGKFKNCSVDAINECAQYVQRPNGSIEHMTKHGRKSEAHGDRVIADAVAWLAAQELCKIREVAPQEKALEDEESMATYLGRRKAWLRRREEYTWGDFSWGALSGGVESWS